VERAKAKLNTKFEVSNFIGFRDIVYGMPNIIRSHDLSHAPFRNIILEFCGNGQDEASTKFEVRSFVGFRDVVESMPNFLGVT